MKKYLSYFLPFFVASIWMASTAVVNAQPPGTLPPGYKPPADMTGTRFLFGERLNRSDTMYSSYSWSAAQKKIQFMVSTRLSSSHDWHPPAKKEETVSFHITAVAPLYATSGSWDTIYVIGVLNNGVTVVEKWRTVVTTDSAGVASDISIEKNIILTSPALTNIRAAAAAPNGQFLVVQRHETKAVLKLDLQTGATTVLANKNSFANLEHYDLIEWRKHPIEGDVFFVMEGGRSTDIFHDGMILIWDDDLDGTPESIEELSGAQYGTRGYNSSLWEPNATLTAVN